MDDSHGSKGTSVMNLKNGRKYAAFRGYIGMQTGVEKCGIAGNQTPYWPASNLADSTVLP
jgi:hypothetical protein